SFYKLIPLDDRPDAMSRRFGPLDAAAVQRGAALYKEKCAICHGDDRAGTPAAPSLVEIGARIGPPQLRRTIVYGSGRMPPIGHIDDEQISDIHAFLGGGPRPRRRNDPAEKLPMPAGPVVASGGAPRE